MNITINISEPIKKVQEFQEYDLGQITTTLQDLLNNSSITINSNTIPILKVLSIDDIVKKYLIKDLTENIYNTGEYITGQDLTENDLLLITGESQGSGINTAFVEKTYAPTMSVVYDSTNPNFDINLTGNLDLTITSTSNGDSGMVNLYFSSTEVATLNGFADLVVIGAGEMIPIYFIHDSDGLKWYNDVTGGVVDLSTFQKYVIKDVITSTPHTGTTAETIIKTYLIPANTFSAEDVLKIVDFKVNKTGTNGTLSYRVRINTTASLAGSTSIAYKSAGGPTLFSGLERTFILTGGLIKGLNGNQTLNTDKTDNSSAALSATFNTAADIYLITTIQLGNAADSATQEDFIVTN